MKKLIVLVLAVCMIVGVFAACGAPAAPAASSSAAPAASSAAPASSSAPAASASASTQTSLDVKTEVSAEPTKAGANYNFAIVYGGVHPFFEPWRFGAQKAALDLKIPTPNVTSPQDWDQTQQNAIIDGLVAGGVGGIGMFTSDAVAGNQKISELDAMGIPVVTMGGAPATPSKAKFCYTTDVGKSVGFATQAIIDKLKADGKTKGNIVHLCSGLADTNTQKRQAAIKEVLAKPENAGFVLYKELPDTDATEPAEKAISTMYASYIKDVDGIVCTGYINAQVLAKTMNERKSNDGVVAIGIDDSQDVLTAISNGYMYGTMTQSSWAMGYVATYALKLFADGYTWKDKSGMTFIDSGWWLCTKDNIKDYNTKQQNMAYDFIKDFQSKYFDAPAK